MQWIPVSNFTVTPVVAVAERRPVLVPQASEVAAILEVPLAAFLPGGELLWVERQIRDWDLRYAAYPVEGLAVWGMTAALAAWAGWRGLAGTRPRLDSDDRVGGSDRPRAPTVAPTRPTSRTWLERLALVGVGIPGSAPAAPGRSTS